MASDKTTVVLTFRQTGIQPPVYVAGGFSSPPWHPIEMDSTQGEDGEHLFTKEVAAEPGSSIQYKFRIGHGDWWVLNEEAPSITDASGNRNNECLVPELPAPTAASSILIGEDEERPGPSLQPDEVQEPDLDQDDAGLPALLALVRPPLDPRKTGDGAASHSATAAIPPEPASDCHEQPMRELMISQSMVEIEDRIAAYYKTNNYAVHDVSVKRGPPLFPHECVGLLDDGAFPQRDPPPVKVNAEPTLEERFPPVTQSNLDDPNLVRFPSARDEIMEAVRHLSETTEDEAVVLDGPPFAPAIRLPLKKLRDNEELFDWLSLQVHSPPPNAGPVTPRAARRLETLKLPDPVNPNQSSSLSLQCISEADEEDAGQVSDTHPMEKTHQNTKLRTTQCPDASDADEAIGLGEDETTEHVGSEDFNAQPTNHVAIDQRDADQEAGDVPVPETARVIAPPLSAEAAELDGDAGIENDAAGAAEAEGPLEALIAADEATSTGVETGPTSQVINRRPGPSAVAAEDVHPPVPAHPTPSGLQARTKDDDNWLVAFLRKIVVEWIGGIISRLCGGKRKTLLTATTAMVLTGLALWKMTGKDRRY